jgi:effector-binding domain-containing protein
MPAFELQERAPTPVLTIRLHTAVEEIPASLAVALPEVWKAAEASGLAPDGPPFTRYLAELSDLARDLDYEAGVPLPLPAAVARGRAVPGELPGGTLAVAWHVGPYDTLGETYGALLAWIGEQGRTVAGPMWEVYWTDPATEPDPARWRTEVIVPVV